jgi:hypothetical protein
VWLSGAKVGGWVDCTGAKSTYEGGNALSAEGVEIGGDVFLRDRFRATGEVRLSGARIGGQLVCSNATLVNEGGDALQARDATITGPLIFRNVRVTGGVDLFRASATALDDDLGQADQPLGSWRGARPLVLSRRWRRRRGCRWLGSWRGARPLVLDGFTYARFGQGSEWDSKVRRRWLEQTSGFQQGAWQQLIEVYRAQGRDDEATRASIAMHNDRVKRAGLPWHRRAGRRVLWAVVGHGYRPWLAGIWAVAIIAAFALMVWQWSGMFVPEQGVTGSPQPIAYATDTFLPIVNLSQADDWMPTGWIRWVVWSVILLGWSLSTIFVAGFTRIVRSE